jgi:hypothetical protein
MSHPHACSISSIASKFATFDLQLRVHLWIGAGGHVGQFEDMKRIAARNCAIDLPDKVAVSGGRVRLWFNVYNPVDSLSFLIDPVFAAATTAVIEDLQCRCAPDASQAHAAYLKRPSLYGPAREAGEAVL